jgi:hypothetical protein
MSEFQSEFLKEQWKEHQFPPLDRLTEELATEVLALVTSVVDGEVTEGEIVEAEIISNEGIRSLLPDEEPF